MDSYVVARHFGTNLRRARRLAAVSQEQLGLLASLHRTEIGLLERGARVPRIDTLLKLTGSLEVSTVELLDGMSWTPGGTQPGKFRLPLRPGAMPSPERGRRRGN
jgi:transcriptional regulator with XRE-family HTH domain